MITVRDAEVLYDLTWNLARDDAFDSEKFGFGDSRSRFNELLQWTEKFCDRHENTDWSKVDYIETVDAFYDEMTRDLRE